VRELVSSGARPRHRRVFLSETGEAASLAVHGDEGRRVRVVSGFGTASIGGAKRAFGRLPMLATRESQMLGPITFYKVSAQT
jgi:hypothetical protein